MNGGMTIALKYRAGGPGLGSEWIQSLGRRKAVKNACFISIIKGELRIWSRKKFIPPALNNIPDSVWISA